MPVYTDRQTNERYTSHNLLLAMQHGHIKQNPTSDIWRLERKQDKRM